MKSRLFSVLALIGLSACDSGILAAAVVESPQYDLMGDSTAFLIREECPCTPVITAPGIALGAHINALTDASSTHYETAPVPDAVVVMLGSNDLAGSAANLALVDTPLERAFYVDHFLWMLPVDRDRVLWVLPGPGVPAHRTDALELTLLLAGVESLRIPEELYGGDGIHFADEAGAAALIVARLDALVSQP